MFKYKKVAENLEPYKIPSTTEYKYKMDMGEWSLPIHPSVNQELKNFDSLYILIENLMLLSIKEKTKFHFKHNR